MGWLGRLVERFSGPQEAIRNPMAAVVPSWSVNRPKESDYDLKAMIDETYRRSALIHACISEISQSVAEPALVVRVRKTKEVLPDDHPLVTLLRLPHPEHTHYTLFEKSLIHLHTTGETFIHKGRNSFGQVIQLTAVRPDRMNPIPGENGDVIGYEYRIDGSPKGQLIPREDIIYLSFPDPLNDYRGLPPILSAIKFAQIDSEASLYLRDFFLNGAVPASLLVLKTAVSKGERLRVKDEWTENFGRGTIGRDKSNWHRVAVLNAEDVDFKDIGVTPEKLKMDSIWGIAEVRICQAFQVPPIIVQSKIGLERSVYSNYETARRVFWSETLRPMYGRYDEALTLQLATEFGEDLEVVFDLSQIPVLQEGHEILAARAVQLFAAGLITRNEARHTYLATDPLPGDDFMIMPGGIIPVDQATSAQGMANAAMPGGVPNLEAAPVAGAIGPGTAVPILESPPNAAAASAGGVPNLESKSGGPRGVPNLESRPGGGGGGGVNLEETPRVLHMLPRAASSSALAPIEHMAASHSDATIDRLKPGFKKALLRTVKSIRNEVDMDALTAAIASRNWSDAQSAIKWEKWKERYAVALKDHLLDGSLRSATATYTDHASVKKLTTYATMRANEETDRTYDSGSEGLRYAFHAVVGTELDPSDAAKVVRSCVGLTDRQAKAVVGMIDREKHWGERDERGHFITEGGGKKDGGDKTGGGRHDSVSQATGLKMKRDKGGNTAGHLIKGEGKERRIAIGKQLEKAGYKKIDSPNKITDIYRKEKGGHVLVKNYGDWGVIVKSIFYPKKGEKHGLDPDSLYDEWAEQDLPPEREAEWKAGAQEAIGDFKGGGLAAFEDKLIELDGDRFDGYSAVVETIVESEEQSLPSVEALWGERDDSGHFVTEDGGGGGKDEKKSGPKAKAADGRGSSAAHLKDGPARESRLASASIVSSKDSYGGHKNTCKPCKLDNGDTAFFKPDAGEDTGNRYPGIEPGHQGDREMAVFEVAKIVGMDKLVAAVIETTLDGQTGTLAEGRSGKIAMRAPYDKRYGTGDDLQRAAIFDFVTGQQDRHIKNWLVDGDKMSMIDNPMSFGTLPYVVHTKDVPGKINSQILANAAGQMHKGHDEVKDKPSVFLKAYADNWHKIKAVLTKRGIDPKAIALVKSRIDKGMKANSFNDLLQIVREP